MSEKRTYFGKKFHRQKDGYWANMMPIHAHRWVWINHHGAIPKGMDIHHIDGDKNNNEINNLEMLSRSDHLKRHWEDPNLREERRKFLDEIRPKVHEWLRSDEGRKSQSESSIKAWKKRKTVTLACIECKKEIQTMQPWAKFCSDVCDKRWRRREKPNRIEIICVLCNKLFFKDKYSPQKFCSISCGAKNSRRNATIK
jgi:hypothetical protein